MRIGIAACKMQSLLRTQCNMTDWKERPTSNASKFAINEKSFWNKLKDSHHMLVFYKRTHSLYRLPT